MDGVALGRILGELLLPPAGPILLILLSLLLLLFRLRWSARVLFLLGFASLIMVSLPPVSRILMDGLQRNPVIDLNQIPAGPRAVVVLGGGFYRHQLDYGGHTVSSATLERLRYASRLARAAELPILVSGGRPEAALMTAALRQDFGVMPKWQEDASRNTAENARFSAQLLREQGIRHVFLVSHAWHLPRAVAQFRQAGLDVTPAPTLVSVRRVDTGSVPSWVPTAEALWYSRLALHEYIGMFWYAVRYPAGSAEPL
ncbi:MAG: YdcF family protein [Gammaproteobacteria bacterium]|nr:YdcF family protein [Gammaproteobacteria bacterium]